MIELATATAADIENAIDDAIENGTESLEDQLESLGGLSTAQLVGAAAGLVLAVIIAVAVPYVLMGSISLLAGSGYLA